MAKNLHYVMLLDCYGEFLTVHQHKMMELYYGADLSLSEIAALAGITRQGVRDSIKRGEQILLEMEEKLQFAARLSQLRENYAEITALAEQMAEAVPESCAVQENCRSIRSAVNRGLALL